MKLGRAVVAGASLGAAALAVHTAVNLRLLRRPVAPAPEVRERVDILIPARNEQDHIARTVASALAQTGVPGLRVVVLDDQSDDSTADIVRAIDDPRVVFLHGEGDPPTDWLGKPWACMRLARASEAHILVFVDADVVLEPHAVRSLVALLRQADLDMVAPYPRQTAVTALERLVQPLVTWSWAATMPVRVAENSSRTSLAAANGQVIVVDARAYAEIDGHSAVAGEVIEDVALMRALKAQGFVCATIDGSSIATCRMYASGHEVVDGYAKSLWAAFGGGAGSAAVCALLAGLYVVPAAAALGARNPTTRAWGAFGYAAGVASRAMVARRMREPILPDALAHPISITAFIGLNAISWNRHLRGTNSWKGRTVVVRND